MQTNLKGETNCAMFAVFGRVLYMCPDKFELVYWAHDRGLSFWVPIVERRNFVKAKNFTGHRCNKNPGPCR